MTEEDLHKNVTIHLPTSDEYFPVISVEKSHSYNCDVLDDNHPYLKINES